MFRFFTVYGPWGRPDMALFKFTKAIIGGEPIDVYNHGKMKRDFTYIDDLTNAINLLVDIIPATRDCHSSSDSDSLSPVAPFRVVNIGNSNAINLEEFICAIENTIGKVATRNMLPMQAGDVHATWANSDLLMRLTGYAPKTKVSDGVRHFVEWYRDYYNV